MSHNRSKYGLKCVTPKNPNVANLSLSLNQMICRLTIIIFDVLGIDYISYNCWFPICMRFDWCAIFGVTYFGPIFITWEIKWQDFCSNLTVYLGENVPCVSLLWSYQTMSRKTCGISKIAYNLNLATGQSKTCFW